MVIILAIGYREFKLKLEEAGRFDDSLWLVDLRKKLMFAVRLANKILAVAFWKLKDLKFYKTLLAVNKNKKSLIRANMISLYVIV